MTTTLWARPVLSERLWPLLRLVLVFLFSVVLGQLVGWGVFVLLVDKLHWLDIAFHGKTLTQLVPAGQVLALGLVQLTTLAVVLLVWRLWERKRWGELLWGFEPGWARALGWGLAAGLAELLLVYAPLAVLGIARVEWGVRPVEAGVWGLAVGWAVVSSLLAPIHEEVWYRGYMFQNIRRGWGVLAATVVTAGFFGGVHLSNPNAAGLGAVNIFLVGVAFVLGMLWTRSLWFPIGWHAAWNFAQFFVVGLPNSGFSVASLGLGGTTLLISELSGPRLLTGGGFGLEASLLDTIALLALIVLLLHLRQRHSPAREDASPVGNLKGEG